MESKDPLPYLQDPASGPCPDSVNPVRNVLFYFPKIHCNIIFSPTLKSSTFRFSTRILYAFLMSPMRRHLP